MLAAHADLATVEYARGQCQVARDRLQDAWELHREVYGDGHPSGIKMLARLGSMQRDCDQFAEAQDNLALARELARQHLAADDPLAIQVAALSRAAANPDHVCADNPPVSAEEPVVPSARTPPTEDIPPASTWPHPRLPDDDGSAWTRPRLPRRTPHLPEQPRTPGPNTSQDPPRRRVTPGRPPGRRHRRTNRRTSRPGPLPRRPGVRTSRRRRWGGPSGGGLPPEPRVPDGGFRTPGAPRRRTGTATDRTGWC